MILIHFIKVIIIDILLIYHKITFFILFLGGFISENKICQKNNIKKFQKFIFIVSDPYESLWYQFQYHYTIDYYGYIKKINHKLMKKWIPLANHYSKIISQEYKKINEYILKKNISNSNYIFIKYENLINNNTQINELIKLTNFLNNNNKNNTNNNNNKSKINMNQLLCSIKLANNQSNINQFLTLKDELNTESNEINEMSYLYLKKAEVYQNYRLILYIWEILGEYANKFGYRPYGMKDVS